MAAAGLAAVTMTASAAASESRSLLIELLPTVRDGAPAQEPAAPYLPVAQSLEYAHTVAHGATPTRRETGGPTAQVPCLAYSLIRSLSRAVTRSRQWSIPRALADRLPAQRPQMPGADR